MDSETIIESSFEYTDSKMYRTIKVTMPPCDTNDDAAWAERNDLAERIRVLLQAQAPQPSDDAKNAARYRWLRRSENDCWMLNTLQRVSEAGLDAAIDAAMAGGE